VATENHAILSKLKLGAGEDDIRWDAGGGTATREQLTEGMQFFLVELLTVLGSLTAEILTPALHEALTAVTAGRAPAARSSSSLSPRRADEENA